VLVVPPEKTIKEHYSKAGCFLSELRKVDGVEIFSIVDNSIDFLSEITKKEVRSFRQLTFKRYGKEWERRYSNLPLAENGFSMFVRILSEGKHHSILFDTGNSPYVVVQNAKQMGLDLSEIEAITLSHGHYDHSGGLVSVLKSLNEVDLPIIVHDDMFKKRGVARQDGTIRSYPEFPTKSQLGSAQIISTKKPSLIANGLALVTGEIPRETTFEKGYMPHKAFVDGKWQPDPWIWDDRAIVINVKEKGLVILSGCAHAGIINTINYSKRITGIDKIYAVIGGFHLAGKKMEGRMERTVKELERINPNLIAPSHCTGWRAKCAIAQRMENAFVWNSVGNLYKI
jgi:7,8-dihydropterin-6-yl-methyl-4-(beta-D-ribofuranosyl)aminobenzene 5'-phosphate synthase